MTGSNAIGSVGVCWGSEGQYAISTMLRDIAAALAILRSGTHREVDSDRLVLVGRTVGGWAATVAGAADSDLRGAAILAAAADVGRLRLTPQLWADWFAPWVASTADAFASDVALAATRYPVVDAARRMAAPPFLAVHGGLDAWVPATVLATVLVGAGRISGYVRLDDAGQCFSWHRAEL